MRGFGEVQGRGRRQVWIPRTSKNTWQTLKHHILLHPVVFQSFFNNSIFDKDTIKSYFCLSLSMMN